MGVCMWGDLTGRMFLAALASLGSQHSVDSARRAKSEAVWDPEELWVGREALLCFPVFFLTLSKRQPGGGEIILQGN